MATTYAQRLDVEAYIEGWVTDNTAALDRLINRAERDIDSIVGAWPILTSGLKFDPTQLATEQKDALKRATCAQAEYRFQMGEEFFVKGQHSDVSSPDFTTKGKLPRIGPKVWQELRFSGLTVPGGRALAGVGSRRSYDSFLKATGHYGA